MDGLLVAEVAEEDFQVRPHVPQWLSVGSAKVCTVCGRFPNGVAWGRAPGQPRLDADSEAAYRVEQMS